METLEKNKKIVMVVILFMLGFLLYKLLYNPEPIITTSSGEIGADLLEMSAELSRATLSREIFSDPGYLLLVDFSTEIPQLPVGRTNPFDIIGRD